MNHKTKWNPNGINRFLAEAFARNTKQDEIPDISTTADLMSVGSKESEWHPAFDPDFLNVLDTGAISRVERRCFLEHLFECDQCRELIALHLRAGVLFGTESDDREQASLRQTNWLGKHVLQMCVTAAVILLVAVGLLLRFNGQPERSLARKEFTEQMAQLESNRFTANLTDCGYRLSGGSYMKSVGLPNTAAEGADLTQDPVTIAFGKLSQEEQKEPALVLQYARFLLMEKKDADTAITVLSALQEDSDIAEVEMLRGIAEFIRKNDGQAQKHFRKILRTQYNESAALNLAISLTRSNQFADARPFFQKVMETTGSATLKLQIENFLKAREKDN